MNIGVAVSPQFRCGVASGGFSPGDIAGLELDLDASKPLTTATGGVSVWPSQVNGWSATQTTEAARPDFNASSANMNGQPSITFGAGSGQFFDFDLVSTSADWTWFAAVYQGGTTPLAALVDDGGGAAFRFRATGGTMYSAVGGSSIGVAMGTSAAHIICARHGAGVGLLQVDGTESAGTLPAFAMLGTGCIGGRYTGSGDEPWVSEVGRVLAYKGALSDTDKDAVVAHLAATFGVSL